MKIRRRCWVLWIWSWSYTQLWATMWKLGTELGPKYWASSSSLRHLCGLILLTHEIGVCTCLCMYRGEVCVQTYIYGGQRLTLAPIFLHLTLIKDSFSLNWEFIGWLTKSWALPVSILSSHPPCLCWNYGHVQLCMSLYKGPGDPNSGPCACTLFSLPIEQSPQQHTRF